VEDRVDTGLWLRTNDESPARGGDNAIWFENACPNRTEFPRKIDESS